MRILVTGGAGYIGSHAVRSLVQRGHEAVIYDNLCTGNLFCTKGYEFFQADLRDIDTLRQALRGAAAVMHFAAHSYVGESTADPRRYFENNVQAGLNLLGAVLDCGIRYFIHSSSCSVYGMPDRVPIPENSTRRPISPYGISKLAMEHALEAYGDAYDLRYMNLRYFNAAGADESAQIGELHDPETHLIPSALEVAAGKRQHLDIYGTNYPTSDGTCIRDYVHVNDLVEAHLKGLEYLASGGPSTAVNLGSGKGYSVLEVLSVVEQVTQRSLHRRVCDSRPGDPAVLVAATRRAQELLRWQPTRSLDKIVSSAWNWMTSRNHLTS